MVTLQRLTSNNQNDGHLSGAITVGCLAFICPRILLSYSWDVQASSLGDAVLPVIDKGILIHSTIFISLCLLTS